MVTKSWYDQGVEKGEALGEVRGEIKGIRQSLRMFLQHRFGTLTETVLQRLQAIPAEEVKQIMQLSWQAQSLKDLGLED
jgi:hypothetical protein